MKTAYISIVVLLALNGRVLHAQPYSVSEVKALGANSSYAPSKYFESKPFMVSQSGDKPCPNIGEGSSAEGSQSSFNPTLNSFKNRDIAPSSYQDLDLERLIATVPQDPGVFKRDVLEAEWSSATKDSMLTFESIPVRVTGYFVFAKEESEGSCNCGSDFFTDYHTWISSSPLPENAPKNPQEAKPHALVAEISPFLLGADHASEHPNWNAKAINELARAGYRVRVSGWLTWDKQHGDQLEPTKAASYAIRVTLWEVHPIHRIEAEVRAGIGGIAGILAAITGTTHELTQGSVMALLGAGYAGTDLIEGFLQKT